MALTVGERLGPYEILALLGAGGMGEVYRARDARLNRDVAIKVSKERFSDRFEHEARAVAALNHPNVCTLYDVGSSYLVMELIEGESPRGPLPLDEALRIMKQVSEALEAAHEKGIVHRDLKPANIKVKPDGSVKVLDFGLAKFGEAISASAESSATKTMSMTREGIVVGTSGYMSPEQALGRAVDKRTDIWAFGVVLYELLTGRRPFQGEDTFEMPAAGHDEGHWLQDVPVEVRRLLKSCLERDPKRRLRDIGDAWRLLEEAPVAEAGVGVRRGSGWAAGIAGMLLLSIAAWGWLRTTAPAPQPIMRWTTSLNSTATCFAISRDGTRLAYRRSGADSSQLMLRTTDQLEAKPIPGAEGSCPAFSPDGKWLIYTAESDPIQIRKIPVSGGLPITLGEDNTSGGASWGEDNTILLGSSYAGQGLRQVDAAGGKITTLTRPDKKNEETSHRFPQWLPGGRAVLFTIVKAPIDDPGRVAVLDRKTGQYRILVRNAADARYVRSGHLLFVRGNRLFAAPFDLKRLEVTGAEIPVVEGVASWIGWLRADYAVADSGMLVYRPGGMQDSRQRRMVWADWNGNKHPVANVPLKNYRSPRLSPDGERAAVQVIVLQRLIGAGDLGGRPEPGHVEPFGCRGREWGTDLDA